jgi:hypothetical protein
VLTIDSAPTSPPAPPAASTAAPTVVERAKPEPPKAVDPSLTVAESAAMGSSVTAIPSVQPSPVRPAAQPAPVVPAAPVVVAKKKSSAGLIIGAVVLLLIVAVVGAASIYLWNRSRTTTAVTTPASSTATVAAPREVSRYWLELEPARPGQESTRVAGLVPIASGQSLKFHFTFSESGYVYIVGPGEKNQPTAFLTTKPLPESGVTTNQVTGGGDFSFPSGAGNNLTLDKNPGTDVFTIIFAKTALPSPAFLNEPVTGKPLSSAQQAELKTLVGKFAEKPPATELDESNPRAPQVRVKVPAEQTSSPIVFDIRIQHN